MPHKASLPRPSEAELEILDVLWRQLAQQALASAKQASPEDLLEIRKMLAEFERKQSRSTRSPTA